MAKEGLFGTGRIIATVGVAQRMNNDSRFEEMVRRCLGRHVRGDWGNVCDSDWKMNDAALDRKNPGRIVSSYEIMGDMVLIITEWDRSYTTILYPEDY